MAVQTITIDGVSVSIDLGDVAVIGAETAIGIILALSPLGIFVLPAWALILLPLIKAELPLAEVLLKEMTVAIEANKAPAEIINYLHNALTNWKKTGYADTSWNDGANTENIWPT